MRSILTGVDNASFGFLKKQTKNLNLSLLGGLAQEFLFFINFLETKRSVRHSILFCEKGLRFAIFLSILYNTL